MKNLYNVLTIILTAMSLYYCLNINKNPEIAELKDIEALSAALSSICVFVIVDQFIKILPTLQKWGFFNVNGRKY